MTPGDYSQAVETLLSAPRRDDRDLAMLKCCLDVVRDLKVYGPHEAPGCPDELYKLHKMDQDARRALLASNAELGQVFGAWRAELTLHEAANANRLWLLASIVLTLLSIRERTSAAPTLATIDQLLNVLGDWMAQAWRVNPPLQGDIRAWAIRSTRRSDLLPNAWRWL